MPPLFALHHETRYRYDRAVLLGPHTLRLCPAGQGSQALTGYTLAVSPTPAHLHWHEDAFGTRVARVVFAERTAELCVTMRATIDWHPENPLNFLLEPAVADWPARYDPRLTALLAPFLAVAAHSPLLNDFLDEIRSGPATTVAFLAHVATRLRERVRYTTRTAPGIQSCDQTLTCGSGSCRDSAWLLIQVLRALGVPARFVSGYLMEWNGHTDTNGATLALHAWAEAFLPGAGWVGLDPTSGLFAAGGHLPLARAPDPAWTAPITGTAEADPIDWSFVQTMQPLPS